MHINNFRFHRRIEFRVITLEVILFPTITGCSQKRALESVWRMVNKGIMNLLNVTISSDESADDRKKLRRQYIWPYSTKFIRRITRIRVCPFHRLDNCRKRRNSSCTVAAVINHQVDFHIFVSYVYRMMSDICEEKRKSAHSVQWQLPKKHKNLEIIIKLKFDGV